MKELLTTYQQTLAKAILETDFQAFETLFDQLLHHSSERYSQWGNYTFLRNLPSYAEFKTMPESQPHVENLEYHQANANYLEDYARSHYFAEVLQAFAIEKQKLQLLNSKFSESVFMQCVEQKLHLHNAPSVDWQTLKYFRESELSKQISSESRQMHVLRIIDDTLKTYGFRVMVWEYWPLNRDEYENLNGLFVAAKHEVEPLLDYEKENSIMEENEEYPFVIETFDDLRLPTPAAPLTEEDKKCIQKAKKTAYPPIAIFLPISLGCAYLVYVTFTDPGFRPSDGYLVGGFLAFLSLASLGMVLAYKGIINRLNRVLEANQKYIFSGKLIKITEQATRSPIWEWTIEHETEYKSIPIRLLHKSVMEGFQSLQEVKEGDWVEVHRAVNELVTLRIKKLPSLAKLDVNR